MKWHKEKADDEAEYEFIVKQVVPLHNVQDELLGGIRLTLNADHISRELIDELREQVQLNPGKERLHVRLNNPLRRHAVDLTSRSAAIRITPAFYQWLKRKRNDGILSFGIVEKS